MLLTVTDGQLYDIGRAENAVIEYVCLNQCNCCCCCRCCCLHMQATFLITAERNRRDMKPRASLLLIVTDGQLQLNDSTQAVTDVSVREGVCV